jgi:hypothetical protein
MNRRGRSWHRERELRDLEERMREVHNFGIDCGRDFVLMNRRGRREHRERDLREERMREFDKFGIDCYTGRSDAERNGFEFTSAY